MKIRAFDGESEFEIEMEDLVTEWIEATDSYDPSRDGFNHWAIDVVLFFPIRGQLPTLWDFILSAYQREVSDWVIQNIAAGPLTDLLMHSEVEFVEPIEVQADTEPKFRNLLSHLRRHTTNDEAWDRVQKAAGRALL